jgi:hypothetical protein
MTRSGLITALLLAGSMVAGCGFGGENKTGAGITGTWDGEYVDDTNSLQRFMTLTLTQRQDTVTGRYECTGTSTAVCVHPANAGDLSGLVTGDNFLGRVRADGNSTLTCDYDGTISGATITGTFTCASDTGKWQVFRR